MANTYEKVNEYLKITKSVDSTTEYTRDELLNAKAMAEQEKANAEEEIVKYDALLKECDKLGL